LLATESRVIARFMDWSEVQLRKGIAWLRRRWRALPKFGKVAVLALAVCGSIAGAYISIQLLRG
jgi:hypothetical protein